MILFVYVPDLYAAVEEADDPTLRARPLIVGGDPRKRGSVTSASAAAREQGVREGMRVGEALALCPEASVRPTRLRRYREVAAELRAILRTATERIEPQGLDGTYLELPATADDVSLAARICVQVRAELGIDAHAGIGPTRFVAEQAARRSGSSVHRVRETEALDFLSRLPATALWGLGPSTAQKLEQHGLHSIGDLQRLELAELEAIVGRNAQRFLAHARAEDRAPLRPQPLPKSFSQERTLDEPTRDLRVLGERIGELAFRLTHLLERERRLTRTLTLGLGFLDTEAVTRTQTFEEPIRTANELRDAALELLSRTQAGVRSVRRVRLQVSNLVRAGSTGDARQLRLF
jgi:DNA polymerase-4